MAIFRRFEYFHSAAIKLLAWLLTMATRTQGTSVAMNSVACLLTMATRTQGTSVAMNSVACLLTMVTRAQTQVGEIMKSKSS